MKKIVIAVFVLAFMVGGVPAYAAECKDNQLDQIGDWAATLGKQGMEKDQILAKRKATRLEMCARKQAKEAEKAAKKAGEDMKKKMGF